MSLHVFCDNSNIWIGANSARAEKEPHIPSYLLRIYFKNLFDLVEGGRPTATKEIAGSLPPECEPLWQYARDRGYNTNLLYRINDGEREREQSVDEALHLKIANALLDYDVPQTLVLMTGDGANSDLRTSFPGQVERALKRGWDVEIWSWKATRSGAYDRLIGMYQNKLRIKELDNYYNQITFVVEGVVRQADGSEVPIPKRVVSQVKG